MTRAATEKLSRSYNFGKGYQLNFEFDSATDEMSYAWTPAVSDEQVAFDLGVGKYLELTILDTAEKFAREVATWLGEPVAFLNPLMPEEEEQCRVELRTASRRRRSVPLSCPTGSRRPSESGRTPASSIQPSAGARTSRSH